MNSVMVTEPAAPDRLQQVRPLSMSASNAFPTTSSNTGQSPNGVSATPTPSPRLTERRTRNLHLCVPEIKSPLFNASCISAAMCVTDESILSNPIKGSELVSGTRRRCTPASCSWLLEVCFLWCVDFLCGDRVSCGLHMHGCKGDEEVVYRLVIKSCVLQQCVAPW